jgi:hypothetical protein
LITSGRHRRTEFLDQLIEQGHVLACWSVNITEVYAGLRPGEGTKTKAFIDARGRIAFRGTNQNKIA